MSKGRWSEGGRFRILATVVGFLVGGLVIGALRPTNTWDFYTYLVLAAVALLYTVIRNYQPRLKWDAPRAGLIEKLAVALAAVLALAAVAILLYQPFAYWFGQGYTSVALWTGDRTPLNSYLTHWGLFLFLIVSWMGWETYHWMKTTPQSELRKLQPHMTWVYAVMILFLILLVAFLILGVTVAVVIVPLGLWVIVLMMKPGQSDGRRFVLFLIGSALTLTLAAEMVYLPGDIGPDEHGLQALFAGLDDVRPGFRGQLYLDGSVPALLETSAGAALAGDLLHPGDFHCLVPRSGHVGQD